MEASDAGRQSLDLVIWDGELRQAAEPLEKNILLMKILYPLANGVAILLALGLSVLFLFQRRREAAILRVLGADVFLTRLALALELLLLHLAGLLLGAGLTYLLLGSESVSALPLACGCYFLGCLAGTAAGGVLITNKRPLELLQGKES